MKKKFKKPFLIAEVGNNHEGNYEVAKKLIFEAAKCGVDAVKFQTFIPELYVNKTDKKRIKQLSRFSLSQQQFYNLSTIARKNKLKFISTPFDLESAKFLNKIVDYFKISSGDNRYNELISKVLSFKKKTIISTGLLSLIEIKKLYKFILSLRKKKNDIALLHCVASYPAKLKDINLERISYIKNNFDVIPGFSDHTIGLSSAIFSYFYGAEIIEKHFTLDNNYSKFRDHKLSLNPNDMKYLVKFFNDFIQIQKPLQKSISKEERLNLYALRRNFYFKQNLKKGEKIQANHLKYVRPAKKNGISKLKDILNKKIKKDVYQDELVLKNII